MKPVLAVRHVSHEGLGTIAEALRRRQVPCQIHEAFASGDAFGSGDVFASGEAFGSAGRDFDPARFSGLIVMGGPMNVDQVDRYPALADEVRWIQKAVDAYLPVLGVCLGAQLLAKALGSRVYANRVKEIGWYEVEWLPAAANDVLFGNLFGVAAKTVVFQWHGDTFDLPRGAVQLARSAQCENQAFRFGDTAYGLQFHMEVTSEIIESWLCQSDNCGELSVLNYIDPAAIRRQSPEKLPNMTAIGAQVFDEFAELCRRGN